MNDRLNEFVQYIDELGVAANTKEAYERDIKLLMKELSEEGIHELTDISSAELMQYIDGLIEKGRSTSTISRIVASIRRYFAFTLSKGYTFSDPSELLKAPKVIRKTPDILSEKDMKRIISSIDTDTAKGVRDKALLELIMTTGIGVSELIALNTEDVDVASQTINIGVKTPRRLSLSKKTTDALKRYLGVRQELLGNVRDNGTFFLSCAGEKMSRQGLWKIIRICGNQAGIKDITPQMLKHSSAVSAMRHGKDVAAVQKMLGHATKAGILEYKSLASEQ